MSDTPRIGETARAHAVNLAELPRIGVGMLGYAFMGKAHSHALLTLPHMVYPPPAVPILAAISGRDAEAVRAAAARFGYEHAYTDWRDLVADPAVQLVDNGGPNNVHAEPCIAAASAGKHVLCEKPLGRTSAEARAMLAAVTRAGVKHMVGFNYRFVPAVRYAYELVQSGALGTIRHFRARYLQDWLADPTSPHSWRLTRSAAGSGSLGDLGAHVIDLARFLVGEPAAVSAVLRTFTAHRPGGTVDVDDAFAATVEFDSGAIGTLEASRVALGRKNHMAFEINGSKGSLAFNLERLNELEVRASEGPGGFTSMLVTDSTHPFMQYWWPTGHIIGWEHTFVHELAHVFDAIVHNRDIAPYGATFEDGYRAAVVCDAIAASARDRSQMRVTY
ncbi:MAG TPA: Gfo/Idh/MocA family oxidoreductase [Chloroflexota bacterium]|nr:Gfo/Idh/MocA family oxidoreductase [Chloroflexota bacterium]